jgi:Tfp pilus assembly protein PilF
MGNSALLEGDSIGALESFLRAEKEDSSLPEVHHAKGLAYFARKDLQSAVKSVRRAVQIKPDYSDANTTLGKFLMDQGKADEAIEYLTRASQDPLYRDSYKPLTQLGLIEYQKGRFSSAQTFFDRAIEESRSTACIAYFYRGHVRMREGKRAEAIRDYENASQKACAQFGEPRLAIALAYKKSGQLDLAKKHLLEVQNRYPGTKVADQAMNHLRQTP